jgi:hypothetical protein
LLDVRRGSGELCLLVSWGVDGPDALAWVAERRSSHMLRRARSWDWEGYRLEKRGRFAIMTASWLWEKVYVSG